MNSSHGRRVIWPVVAGALLALLSIACADSGAKLHAASAPATTMAADSPDGAVRLEVESTGAAYAGDCGTTRSPEDAGKVCSKFVDEQDGVRAYMTGRTFSEFSAWVFVRQGTSGGQVVDSKPLDFFDMSDTIPWP
jgi:hypothetical protein